MTDGGLDLRAEVVARVGASFDSLELLSGGQANLNVRLDRNRVLRIYVKDPAATEKERLLLEWGWERFRVPEVLERGEDFLVLEWIDLAPVADDRRHGELAGSAAGEIHGHEFGDVGMLDSDLSVSDPLPVPADYLASRVEELGPPWGEYLARLESLAPIIEEEIAGREGVLNHGDFKASNLFVDVEGRLVVLDWEFAFSGSPLFDVGQLFRWGVSPQFRAGFVRGYSRQGGALPPDWERRAEILDIVNFVGLAAEDGAEGRRTADLRARLEKTLYGTRS